MTGFIPNPYAVQSPIGQSLQNIAMAMFARPPVNRELEDSQIANYKSQAMLNRAKMQKEQAEAEQAQYMLENADRIRQSSMADFITGASGLDQEKAGALALNSRLGFELIPEFNDMNPQEQQMPLRAARMALGASGLNPATKVGGTGGASSTDDVIKGFATGLDALNKQAVIDGAVDKGTQQRYGFVNGRERYDNAGDGVIIDQLQESPIAAVIGNNMKNVQVGAKVNANKALANQRNTAASLNSNNARVAGLKGDMLQNWGGQDDVVIGDANSPTGFSRALPNGKMAVGAPIPSKSDSGVATAKNGKDAGFVYKVNKAGDIDKIIDAALGIDKSKTDISAKGRIPLANSAYVGIRNRAAQYALQEGVSGGVTDSIIQRAIADEHAVNPKAFSYKKLNTDWIDEYEDADRFLESGIASTVVSKPSTKPSQNSGQIRQTGLTPRQALIREAQQAIDSGADPEQVNKRLKEMLGSV